MKPLVFALLTLALLALSCADVESLEEETMNSELSSEMQASELAQEILLVDTHIDVPYRLTSKKMEDISQRTEAGEFDYPRAREGGLDAAFVAIYVPAKYQKTGGARKIADDLVDLVEGFVTKSPDKFALSRSPEELIANHQRGLFSMCLGIENGAAIDDDLGNLEHFHRRGVRYITLVHGTDNLICDSSYDDTRTWKGLSPFGKEVVAEMNRLGIMIDVSHVSDDSFFDVMQLSKAPVIASHSSCRHFTPDWERNMSDEMIRLLAEKDGVIQINFGSMFLTDEYRQASRRVEAILEEKGLEWDTEEARAVVAQYRENNLYPEVNVSDVADHIDHVVKLVGVEHVGIGSDYDGVGGHLPVGLEDVSCYPNLIRELLDRDYNLEDIRRIAAGNLLRVWSEVERIGSELG